MTTPESVSNQAQLESAPWRKSSFSGDQGACVEAAPLLDGRIAVRNSNHPGAGTVFFTRTEMDAWIKGSRQASSTTLDLRGSQGSFAYGALRSLLPVAHGADVTIGTGTGGLAYRFRLHRPAYTVGQLPYVTGTLRNKRR
ncbi:hypothetical protein Smic_59160 [Streptomyces microflavus]|uniref:DUF397 domain-containing protein n=1 Tax=Streptomyces microflavus TaxID=1919 RepID=A0A7J0CXV6_STRMI|nr:hypothetical protein Smic_59160 [Streptomyces microflavus]